MSDVLEFKPSGPPELLIGPFSVYHVVVDGRVIPGLTGSREGEHVWLTLDNRFSGRFTEETAEQAAYLIANALAIGQGYSHMGAESKDMPFAPRVNRLIAGEAP